MVDWLVQLVSNAEAPWAVFFLSMLPVTELRIAIPLGVAWGMQPFSAFIWAIAGNFMPVIPLMLLLSYILRLLANWRPLAGLLKFLEESGARHEAKVQRYGLPGLALLVAIPLPGTGVWTGCLVATLLRLPIAPAVAAITAGEVVAGILVTAATSGLMALSSLLYGEYIILAIALLFLLLFFIRRRKRK